MENNNQFFPGNNENRDRDQKLKEELGAEVDLNNLSYNEEEDSFELDVAGKDTEYDHPDPYDTSVKNGGDSDSDYDEANPTAVNEYDKDLSLETEVDKLAMHIDNGEIVQLDPIDKELSHTDEDERDDLDEEGYPKNDADL